MICVHENWSAYWVIVHEKGIPEYLIEAYPGELNAAQQMI